HGRTGFGNDGGVGHAGLVADALDAEHHVVGVFLQGVVDRRLEVGLRAVVVDAQAAADVQVADPGADPGQLDVNPRRLGQGALDAADVGDLAAEVEVDQLEAVGHVLLFQVLQGFEDLGQGQAELGAEAGTVAPAAGAPGRQLDAHAQHRPDVQLLGVADQGFQLGELLDDGNDLL